MQENNTNYRAFSLLVRVLGHYWAAGPPATNQLLCVALILLCLGSLPSHYLVGFFVDHSHHAGPCLNQTEGELQAAGLETRHVASLCQKGVVLARRWLLAATRQALEPVTIFTESYSVSSVGRSSGIVHFDPFLHLKSND